jgi:UrcA family protein
MGANQLINGRGIVMKKRSVVVPVTSCLALAAGFAFCSGVATAQQGSQARTQEEVIVEAPRLVRKDVGRGDLGGKVELISLTRRVSYSDLNLAMHADVMKLEQRINDTAKEACGQLEQLYPLADPETPNCVGQAVKGAMEQAQKVIDAAAK